MILGVVLWWAVMPRYEAVSRLAGIPKPWMVSCECQVSHGTSDNTAEPMQGLPAVANVLRMGY